MAPPDDLVARAQAGDQTAFRDLYRQHVGRVYALCLRLTGNSGDAEERTQDVFVRLWDKLRTFRGESAFSSWLHRLVARRGDGSVASCRWKIQSPSEERSTPRRFR